MKTLTVHVDESGIVRIPPESRRSIPSRFMLMVAELRENDLSGEGMARIAQEGGAFDFLGAEPDLYSDGDIEPGQENPDFAGHATNR